MVTVFLQGTFMSTCIKQLAINQPVLTGSELEIVNSIVGRLLITLTKAVPESDTPERAY